MLDNVFLISVAIIYMYIVLNDSYNLHSSFIFWQRVEKNHLVSISKCATEIMSTWNPPVSQFRLFIETVSFCRSVSSDSCLLGLFPFIPTCLSGTWKAGRVWHHMSKALSKCGKWVFGVDPIHFYMLLDYTHIYIQSYIHIHIYTHMYT